MLAVGFGLLSPFCEGCFFEARGDDVRYCMFSFEQRNFATLLTLPELLLQRYDVVSTSVGALSVTSYCVWRGQDPWLALSITAASVVTALVSSNSLGHVHFGDSVQPDLASWYSPEGTSGWPQSPVQSTFPDQLFVDMFIRSGFQQLNLTSGWSKDMLA
jgi:hypothetical protein